MKWYAKNTRYAITFMVLGIVFSLNSGEPGPIIKTTPKQTRPRIEAAENVRQRRIIQEQRELKKKLQEQMNQLEDIKRKSTPDQLEYIEKTQEAIQQKHAQAHVSATEAQNVLYRDITLKAIEESFAPQIINEELSRLNTIEQKIDLIHEKQEELKNMHEWIEEQLKIEPESGDGDLRSLKRAIESHQRELIDKGLQLATQYAAPQKSFWSQFQSAQKTSPLDEINVRIKKLESNAQKLKPLSQKMETFDTQTRNFATKFKTVDASQVQNEITRFRFELEALKTELAKNKKLIDETNELYAELQTELGTLSSAVRRDENSFFAALLKNYKTYLKSDFKNVYDILDATPQTELKIVQTTQKKKFDVEPEATARKELLRQLRFNVIGDKSMRAQYDAFLQDYDFLEKIGVDLDKALPANVVTYLNTYGKVGKIESSEELQTKAQELKESLGTGIITNIDYALRPENKLNNFTTRLESIEKNIAS